MKQERLDPTRYPDFYRRGGYSFLPQALLDRFRSQVSKQIRTAIRKSEKQVREAESAIPLADDIYEAMKDRAYYEKRRDEEYKLHALLQELTILSAYRYLEVAMSTRLTEHFPDLDPRQMHKSRYIQQRLPFLHTLVGADAVEELRLLNNCIKHSGRVSRQLSRRYPSWREGDALSGLELAYERIAPFIGAYWVDFVQTIKEFTIVHARDI
jgi:hypothetical protein